uniref:Tubulin--tyrosine ligase-like protein 5 n=1 Tax=Echeneis naucrates TaxID=173247 RepID=A0A665WE86_ECHNA
WDWLQQPHDPDTVEADEDEREIPAPDHPCITWSGLSKTIPVLLFVPEAVVSKDGNICSVGERYNLAFKIVRTESRLVRRILTNHGFHEVHPNSNDYNLMWTGAHLRPYILRSLQDFQKVNHFPRSYELTRKDRLYKNIQRMQQTHGFKNFHIVPQTFVLPSEYQEFCNFFAKDRGPWIIKPVASSRGRGIYLVSNPNQISMDENILVSRYINNPLLIDEFKFDVRLYVLITSYDPLIIYVYEEGLARFATVKYDRTSKNIKNTFMHLTNYSVNKKSSDYVSCDDPEVEDYGNKWSMSAVLRYLKQEGKDTTLLMRQVEDLIIKAILSAELQIATACKMFVPHKTNCFELYGFDVLIDSNLKPWLLEVNLSPSLACDAPLDLKIKASMIADMFSLVGFVCQDPLSRQPRSDRVTQDQSLKNPAPSRTQIKVLRRIKEEYERRGGFIRIFPTTETWELYGNVNGNVQLQVDAIHGCHVVQYERKLLSLEARKRRQRHLTHRSAAGKKKSGKPDVFCLSSGSNPEYNLYRQLLLCQLFFHYFPSAIHDKFSSLSFAFCSKIQARMAFSSYLQRVQRRLLAESRASTIPTWPEKDNDQMELVIRFLKRAANNLQQDIKVVLPGRQLPLQDRRRILSHQLGEFIHCYNKETEHMVKKQEKSSKEHCVNPAVFQEYIIAASENDLEEVLTFYTQKNKSATVFLGTKVKSVKKDSSLSTGKVSSDPDIKAAESQPSVCALSEEQQAVAGNGKTQPDVQASQHCSSFPVSLDCTHIRLQHCLPAPASLPLHCPPPPPPPQPPSYAQSLAKSQFCHAEILCNPPAYTSAPVVTQPLRALRTAVSTGSNTDSSGQTTQVLRRIQSFTLSTSSSGATSSIPNAAQIYSQKLSRPTSAGQGKIIASCFSLKSNSMGAFKDLKALSAQAQSNQQAFISALQKLADKQVACHYASSSHINLLTQHVSLLAAASLAPSPPSPIFPTGLSFDVRCPATSPPPSSSSSSPSLFFFCQKEGLWDGQMQNAYSLAAGVNPQLRHQPTEGSYQLQFAIQQLQQQKLKSRQFLDQSHRRHQVSMGREVSVISHSIILMFREKKIASPSFCAVALKEYLNRKSVFIHFPEDFVGAI